MNRELVELFSARRGHFALESGHHGDLWLDLELLGLRTRQVEECATLLATELESLRVEAICSPLIEGAFVGWNVASMLDLPFTYTVPFDREQGGLFPIAYALPGPLPGVLEGRRVAVVNDVINAGSAVLGTLEALEACHAKPVVVSALLVLGSHAAEIAAARKLVLQTLATWSNSIWEPDACPLCAAQTPLVEFPTEPGAGS